MAIRRRLLTVTGSMLVILMLTASTALAHFCYNASRSDTGNARAAQSQAMASGSQLLAALDGAGCTAESDALEAALEADGLDPADVVVNEKAVMAGGTVGTDRSTDGKGIDHLSPAVLAEVGAAFACLEGGGGAL